MIRHVFERGLASLIARWMIEGSSEALFERIAKAGALDPAELEKLRRETHAYLEKVRDEGAPYADLVLSAVKGVTASLPDLRGIAAVATQAAVQFAARSAEAAASHAQELAEQIRVEQARAEQARADKAGAETERAEQARADKAGAETERAEQARAEQARPDKAGAETERADRARAETERAGSAPVAPETAAEPGVAQGDGDDTEKP